jgi:hypothetical protein
MSRKKLLVSIASISAAVLLALTGCAVADAPTTQVRTAGGYPRLTVAPLDRTGSEGSFSALSVPSSATPEVPANLMVYRVIHNRVTVAEARAKAGELGVHGSESATGTQFRVEGAGADFQVDIDTGSFDYMTKEFELQTTPIKHLLTDEQYRKKAEEFLVDHGLFEASARFRDVNRGNVVGINKSGKWVERPYLIEARFDHEPLDGVAFDQGVGPKIIVQFGEDGRVIGATSLWREVEPVSEYPTEPVSRIAGNVTAGAAQVFNAAAGSTGTVTSMTISYISDPAGYRQEYVVPHYVLRGQVGSTGREFTAITRSIPAQYLSVDPSVAQGAGRATATGRRRK